MSNSELSNKILAEWSKIEKMKYENVQSLYFLKDTIGAIKAHLESEGTFPNFYFALTQLITESTDYPKNAGDAAHKKRFKSVRNKLHNHLFSMSFVRVGPRIWE